MQGDTKHPRLLKLLEEGGASFLTRLSREEGKPPSELLNDLLDLVWEGRVSNDQFAPLRLRIDPKHANWAKTGSGLGRWYATSTLHDPSSADNKQNNSESPDEESPVLSWIHHLLKVYGLLNKELVARTAPFSWDTFYPVLKRLEQWGVLTRGTFIQGMSTLQFTTRELSDAVRQPLPDRSDTSSTLLSSADPANPFGMMIDWPQGMQGVSYSRKPGNFMLLQGAKWLFWLENNGKKVFSIPESHAEMTLELKVRLLETAFQAIIRRRKLVKISVDQWNGEPIVDTEAGKLLMEHGAERDLRSLVFWSK
jgi:ATP-dependent Lhr-like helicase